MGCYPAAAAFISLTVEACSDTKVGPGNPEPLTRDTLNLNAPELAAPRKGEFAHFRGLAYPQYLADGKERLTLALVPSSETSCGV